MIRKLQQSGRLFFVNTPSEWVNSMSLKKGDLLELVISDELTIKPVSKQSNRFKKTSLIINNTTPKALSTIITSFFVAGFDEFELVFKKELSSQSYNELKQLINDFGLNMINLSKDKVKVNINVQIINVKAFVSDFIKQIINFIRMLCEGESDLIKNQLLHFSYQKYLLLRTIYRYQQGLTNLDIKLYETGFYQIVGRDLSSLALHLSYINDTVFLKKVLSFCQELFNFYKNPSIDFLTKIVTNVESLKVIRSSKVKTNEHYRMRRVFRSLKDITRDLSEIIAISK